MAGLKEYKITTENGYETTILLSDEDAKTRGLFKEPAPKQAAAPRNKQAKSPASK